MAQPNAKIRLYLGAALDVGAEVVCSREQAHFLAGAMRRGAEDTVLLFNGRDGEWRAEIARSARRGAVLVCVERTRAQTRPPDLWLCFAPVGKARTDLIAEKACEMGCRRLVPVLTRLTAAGRVHTDRLTVLGIEAAERCGLLSVPEVAGPVILERLLADWPDGRALMFCDESGAAPPAAAALGGEVSGPWAILTGPESGFAPDEAARLRALPFTVPVSLGPRIMRADTAAVAALAVWQSVLGDWR